MLAKSSSTVHSFKGWECSTVFVVLEDQAGVDRAVSDELIYTAFTRSRDRLVLINLDCSRYETFFSRELPDGLDREWQEPGVTPASVSEESSEVA